MEEVHEKMTTEPCAPERTSDVWSTNLPKWTLGFLCLVMISSSAAIYTKHYFYSVHVRQNTDAMKLIRNFILQHNESMETLKDSDILNEVEKMICQVAQIYQERAEIQTLIDTLAMINHGWTVINGSLYYVFSDLVTFYEAQKTCESINTTLAIVIHPQVELFLESQSKKLNQGIWVGLQFLEKNWQWIDGKTPYHPHFWMAHKPDPASFTRDKCVEIKKDCLTPGNCWSNLNCHAKRIPACKLDPSPKGMG
ncbi:C-type lectin domain family 4 member F-like isoform X2 [Crotalus tigris]|uniref:C-type lectin domain family 4 member F-like isoform X2 n=1 Tax=Crotalus tigris TaxID=88082 RepID=UPI00192F6622|nr:C-type lectin domain family 4 member F-like isoform X2 [Crotalus tigris]